MKVENQGAPLLDSGILELRNGARVVDPRLYEQAQKGTWSSIHAVLDGPKGWLGREFNYRPQKNSPL